MLIFLGMETVLIAIWPWVAFNLFVVIMLALDLGVFHRTVRVPTLREAAGWTTLWVSLALLFAGGLYRFAGADTALQFITGYILEYSLSVDNIFVFILIFSYFRIPLQFQHRVLFWGIIGAVVMRATFIIIGASLLARFGWVMWVLGAFLIVTGFRMATQRDESMDPTANPVLRWMQKRLPMTDQLHGHHFFVREGGRLVATPLFLVLVLLESTDVVFALDSIPAIFGVTRDPFIVYTSNIFAILGLRSLYFLLAGVVGRFRYLKLGLSGVLVFIGTKMVLSDVYHVPTHISLLVIVSILSLSVIASLVIKAPPEARGEPIGDEDGS